MSIHLPTDEIDPHWSESRQEGPGRWTYCCGYIWLIVLIPVIYAIGWYISQGMK